MPKLNKKTSYDDYFYNEDDGSNSSSRDSSNRYSSGRGRISRGSSSHGNSSQGSSSHGNSSHGSSSRGSSSHGNSSQGSSSPFGSSYSSARHTDSSYSGARRIGSSHGNLHHTGSDRGGSNRDDLFRDNSFRSDSNRDDLFRDNSFRSDSNRDDSFRGGPFNGGSFNSGPSRNSPYYENHYYDSSSNENQYNDAPEHDSPYYENHYYDNMEDGGISDSDEIFVYPDSGGDYDEDRNDGAGVSGYEENGRRVESKKRAQNGALSGLPDSSRGKGTSEARSGAWTSTQNGIGNSAGSSVQNGALSGATDGAKSAVQSGTRKKRGYEERKRQVAIAVAVFLLIYAPSVFNWLNNGNMATDILRSGVLIEAINVDAIIMRDEELVVSYTDGLLIPAKSEGEKVSAYSKIATVYNRSSLELMEELKKKNRAIIESQYEKFSGSVEFSKDTESIETDIARLVQGIVPQINRNSLYKAAQNSREINALVAKKADLFGNMPTNDAYISQLMRERDALEERVDVNSSGLFAPSAGYVSFVIDGNESELTIDRLPYITYNIYSRIVDENKKDNNISSQFYSGVSVSNGEAFSKIVRTNNFHFIINVRDEQFEETFNAGDSVRIRTVSPVKEFENAEIIYKSEKSDNGTIYVFRVQKYLFDFIDRRVINIEVIQKYQEGLKIPVSCLKDYSKSRDYAYIALLDSGSIQLSKVRILASNDEYAVIEAYGDSDRSVSLYSRYVRDPVNVGDGKK